MISKRTRRYSQPQERLKQFALNSSKGIDETKPITDPDTISDAVNLTVNDDGSMSLRKPLRKLQNVPSIDNGVVLYTIPLFDEAYRMVVYLENGDTMFKIFDSKDTECSVLIDSDDYYTYTRYVLADSANPDKEIVSTTVLGTAFEVTKREAYSTIVSSINLTNATWVNTPTSTVINGAKLLLSVFSRSVYPNASATDFGKSFEHVDKFLYDGNVVSIPRRLIVTKRSNTKNGFCVTVHTPELATVVSDGSGTVSVAANLMLDNPYAVRDVYNTSVPRIRGIIALYKPGRIASTIELKDADSPYSILFEYTGASKYSIVNTISANDLHNDGEYRKYANCIVKAICDIPSSHLSYAARWSYSFDGLVWEPQVTVEGTSTTFPLNHVYAIDGIDLEVPVSMYDSTSEDDSATKVSKTFYNFDVSSADAVTGSRPDILAWKDVVEVATLLKGSSVFAPSMYLRFDIVEYTSSPRKYKATVASSIFKMPIGNVTETTDTPYASAVLGNMLYYKKTLYTFGAPDQGNLIYASDIGSNITPLSNVIDLNLQASGEVTAIVPWREYLIAFTTHAVFLLQKADEGFYSKTINAAFGVSKEDGKCVVASLNGVFLKHDDCIYFTYPNLYASTDNVMQFTDVSKPVHNILQEHFSTSDCFATLVQEKYVLLAPAEEFTECLVYDIAKRSWEHYRYPIKLSRFQTTVANGTVAVVDSGEHAGQYHIFKEFEDSFGEYADALITDPDTSDLVSIQFSLDTGQKTDNIAETKQFVESKLMFATLSDTDAFPFTLYVAIDGDPHVTKKDIGTDAPFWKPDPANASDPTLGVLNTSFKRVEDGAEKLADSFNVLRQLVVRYSGKGKSIRHLIEGESQSNFKLYETYVRYKPLSNR